MLQRHAAADRARGLERRHEDGGSSCPADNPSSGVYRLLDSIGALDPE